MQPASAGFFTPSLPRSPNSGRTPLLRRQTASKAISGLATLESILTRTAAATPSSYVLTPPVLSLAEIESLLAETVLPKQDAEAFPYTAWAPETLPMNGLDDADKKLLQVVRFECGGAKFVIKTENLPAVLASEAFRTRLADCEQVVFATLSVAEFRKLTGLDLN